MQIGIAAPVLLEKLDLSGSGSLPIVDSFPITGILANKLLLKGHQVDIFCLSPNITSPKVYAFGQLTIHVCPRRTKWASYNFYRSERLHLLDAINSSNCDLIHAHWSYEYAAAVLDSNKRALITAHDSPLVILRYFIPTRAALFWIFRVALGISVLTKAKNLTAVSAYLKESLLKTLPIRVPIQVVQNGIGDEVLEVGSRRIAAGLQKKSPVFVSILEGFTPRKNPKVLLKAFGMVREKYPEVQLVMFGKDYEPGGKAQTWAEINGLSQNVDFRGHALQQSIHRYMEEHAIAVVHPSLEESFGMVPLEGMAMGIPVIGGNASGEIPNLLDKGKAGMLVDMKNPSELAAAMIKVVEGGKEIDAMTANAWYRASTHYGIYKMVEGYLSAYERLLKS